MFHGAWAVAVQVVEGCGGLGGAAAWLTFRLRQREVKEAGTKSMVDIAHSLTETSLALLKPVQEAAAKAEEQVKALREQVTELEAAVTSLTVSLADATARFSAERDDLLRQLAEMTAERDRLAARLAGAGQGLP